MNDEFRPIPGYLGCYSIKRDGTVRSEQRIVSRFDRGIWRSQTIRQRELAVCRNSRGQRILNLSKHGIARSYTIERLLEMTWR